MGVAQAGCSAVIRGGGCDVGRGVELALGVGQFGRLGDRADGAGESDEVQALQFERDAPPGLVGLAFGDADQAAARARTIRTCARMRCSRRWKTGRSSSRGLQVAEAAFGFEQVLVAERDVLGAEVGVEVESRNLPSRRCSAAIFCAVDPQPPGRGLAQVAPEGRVVAERALGAGVRVARLAPSWPSRARARSARARLAVASIVCSRWVRSRSASAGLWQMMKRLAASPSPIVDLLDAQVVADGLVAALARERRLRVRGAVAHPLAGDPVPARPRQVAQVLIAGEAAVDDRHDAAQAPAAQAVLDLADHRSCRWCSRASTSTLTGHRLRG